MLDRDATRPTRPALRVRVDEAGAARFRRVRGAGRRRPMAASDGGGASCRRPTPTTGWTRPGPRLRPCPGGVVDLSIGTPTDPPPAAALAALAGGPRPGRSAATRRRSGTRAAAGHPGVDQRTRFGVGLAPRSASPSAWAPRNSWPRCRTGCKLRGPRARHRPVPGRVLPDLRDGGHRWPGCGRCRCRSTRRGGSTCRRSRGRRGPGPAAVGQHSRQPGRRPGRPGRGGGVGPASGVSRSSATSATPSSPGTGRPGPCSARGGPDGLDGVVAVHSLSKRSNLAGHAGGLVQPGTPSWCTTCGRSASTPASWCPGRCSRPPSPPWRPATSRPSGSGTGPGWSRAREILAGRRGRRAPLPAAGFYLWAPAPGARPDQRLHRAAVGARGVLDRKDQDWQGGQQRGPQIDAEPGRNRPRRPPLQNRGAPEGNERNHRDAAVAGVRVQSNAEGRAGPGACPASSCAAPPSPAARTPASRTAATKSG